MVFSTPRYRSNLSNLEYSNNDRGRVYQNCKLHDWGALVSGRGDIVKMQYFFFSCLHRGMDQINKVYSNNDQGRVYQNCKFHDPQGWGSYARAWSYKSLQWICIINLLPYQYTAHYLLLHYGTVMVFSYAIVDLYIFYDGAVDVQILALLTRSHCSLWYSGDR